MIEKGPLTVGSSAIDWARGVHQWSDLGPEEFHTDITAYAACTARQVCEIHHPTAKDVSRGDVPGFAGTCEEEPPSEKVFVDIFTRDIAEVENIEDDLTDFDEDWDFKHPGEVMGTGSGPAPSEMLARNPDCDENHAASSSKVMAELEAELEEVYESRDGWMRLFFHLADYVYDTYERKGPEDEDDTEWT